MSIEWTVLAAGDLDGVMEYVGRDDWPTAERVGREIVAAVSRLAAFPGLGRPGRVEGTRELIVPDIPYIVVYEVRGDRVCVLRLLHAAQAYPPQQ
ncbi:type II toxin-antitoxin system RelE/ParE family toxin [Desulfolutivibrio sp.]|uniref:type II toxin-antitoxin system RelE/ParE family toxin n=1 Tax=Desulfolutivibrio sp. TaxID=2773296 RepID=UPI002F9644BA